MRTWRDGVFGHICVYNSIQSYRPISIAEEHKDTL